MFYTPWSDKGVGFAFAFTADEDMVGTKILEFLGL